MARHVGAHAQFSPSKEFEADIAAMIGRVGDLSPAMEKGSKVGYDDVTGRLRAGGDGDWRGHAASTVKRWGRHPLGVNKGGGFVSTMRRDWSKKNFVVFTSAAHAHLFGDGTLAHFVGEKRTSVYNSRRRHLSRGESHRRIGSTKSKEQQPARQFAYFSQKARDLVADIVMSHLLGESKA
jgi:hypothetical protein